MICATPRSGTTLLCDLLADTGVAGRPDAFFQLQSRRWWANYLGVPTAEWKDECAFDQRFLAAVLKEGAGGTSVFGMRLMWRDFDALSNRLAELHPGLPSDSMRFRAAFGSMHHLHLTREDKIVQSVSLVRAEQSGLWHVNADGTERERLKPEQTPTYDARVISERFSELEKHDAAWLNWFSQQDIRPVRITYEALANDPHATLAIVLSSIGLDPESAKSVEPRTRKLANADSDEWVRRFRAERVGQDLPA